MRKVILVLLAVVWVLACVPGAAAQGDPPVYYGLERYENDFYAFYYPANATLEIISETELRVLGPEVTIRPVDYDFQITGSAYQMTFTLYDNPDFLLPPQWAEQAILADWQTIQDLGGPNTLPVSGDGVLDEDALYVFRMGDTMVAQAEFFGGDRGILRFYIATYDKILVVQFDEELVPNNPLALMQQDVYTLIMSTLEVTFMG
ncbi:MAG: hypothetical protein GYB65_16885 [Chloroflexi bacterium]|nr:hypothetical protein [Chloroflexota bacterium]